MLKVENINIFYGDLQVLWDVSLEVRQGEIVCLVGSNGAGKSTLLKSISGLLRPREGCIRFLDRNICGMPAHRVVDLGLVHIPEGRRLFPELTTLENLELGSLRREAKAKRKEALERVFELMPRLRERRSQFAGTLSGGEQQMLAVARGLMSEPRLLMLDEPSLGLAPVLVKQVFDIVEKLRKEGITVLIVEQNVRQSLQVCDRAYVLENGRITMEGASLLEDDRVRQAYLGL
jgi:branched-chain amino acid transport system ATP-binding protein